MRLRNSHSGSPVRRLNKFFLIIIALMYAASIGKVSIALDYKMPPKAIAELLDAPTTPDVSIDPTKQWLLILDSPPLISIEELAQPELRLAGIRMNPETHSRSRSRQYNSLKLLDIKNGMEYAVKGISLDSKIHSVRWSPNGKYFAFVVTKEKGQELWVADVSLKTAAKLLPESVSSVYGFPYAWFPDSNNLVLKTVPKNAGEPPERPRVPAGPVVQETSGNESPVRTYQDLLKNPHDEALFEHYFRVDIMKVSIDGDKKHIGNSGIIRRIEPSPDGRYILVETVHRPYSYLVPASRFPCKIEVWDENGKLVKQMADIPLAENIPIARNSVRTGPRSFDWRPDEPATLFWAEAQDGGDARVEADIRDTVFLLSAPFSARPQDLISLKLRYTHMLWSEKGTALVYTQWWKDRRTQVWKVDAGAKAPEGEILFDYSWQDRYNDPGSPLMKRLPNGHYVMENAGSAGTVCFVGAGASSEGDRPFADAVSLSNKTIKRLFRSEAPYYEMPVFILSDGGGTIVTRRESVRDQPNYYIRDLKQDSLSQLTKFSHPTPQLKGVHKEQIRYKRDDGVTMTATLYLPPGYDKRDGPLPLLMWAYPREFKSADAADQVIGSPYRFATVSWSSPLLWLVHGYAVLDSPTMPIIGEGDKEPNDTYVKQLVASAKAAVDEVVRRGIADPGRIGIGGHSYGAFMAANLLAHSDLFAAGIARSGAYNRTLTPFGFQSEDRIYWEAPDVYYNMSPFMHTDTLDEPILIIHGSIDNNSGTFPIQSERLYHALKGLGGTARLVMLPLESHGYIARESVMHNTWEITEWLDTYVKNRNRE